MTPSPLRRCTSGRLGIWLCQAGLCINWTTSDNLYRTQYMQQARRQYSTVQCSTCTALASTMQSISCRAGLATQVVVLLLLLRRRRQCKDLLLPSPLLCGVHITARAEGGLPRVAGVTCRPTIRRGGHVAMVREMVETAAASAESEGGQAGQATSIRCALTSPMEARRMPRRTSNQPWTPDERYARRGYDRI